VVDEIIEAVLIVILTGVENDCPATVAVPGPNVHDPAPQFVPAMVAADPLNDTHMRFAELFISIRPRTLPLMPVMACAVPPDVIVPEQSVAIAAPAAPHQTSAAITHDIIFRILVISSRSVSRHIPRFDKI